MTCVPVGTLTDAELAVLVGPGDPLRPRPVMPAWSRLAPGEREAAAREARRRLVAGGLVTPDESPVGVRRDVRSVLTLRAAAGSVIAAVRRTPRGGDHWYAHRAGDVVLLEQVSDAGHHCFALATAAVLPALVAAAVLHPGATAAADATPDAETDWLRADVELRTDGRRVRRGWVSGPTGTWQLPGRPTDPEDVVEELEALLAEDGQGA